MRLKIAQQGNKENVARAHAQQQLVPAVQRQQPRSMATSLLSLQRTHGNRFVQRLFNGGMIQRKCACSTLAGTTGECAECSSKQLALQHGFTNQAERSEVPPILHEVLRSPGQPLNAKTRAFMESRFGHDFSQVRVHTDAKAAESAQAVNALAYTVGGDVVFGAGKYSPHTSAGQQLIAHELTHVVQQRSGTIVSPKDTQQGTSSNPFEQQADRIAQAVMEAILLSPEPMTPLAGPMPWLQRTPDEGEKGTAATKICEGKTLINVRQDVKEKAAQAKKNPSDILVLYRALKQARVCFPEFGEAEFLSLEPSTKIYNDKMRQAVGKSYKGATRDDDRKMIWAESKKPLAGYLVSGFDIAARFTTQESRRQLGYTLTPSHQGPKEFSQAGLDVGTKEYSEQRRKAHRSFSEADVLVFSGDQYAQFKLPGYWWNRKLKRALSKELDILNMPSKSNVKLIIGTSCATLCKEAAAVWKSQFPNAVFLGFKLSAPEEQESLAKAFAAKLPEDLLLEPGGSGIQQAVTAWKSVVATTFAGNANVEPGWLDVGSGRGQIWDGKKWIPLQADSAENACKLKGDYTSRIPRPSSLDR